MRLRRLGGAIAGLVLVAGIVAANVFSAEQSFGTAAPARKPADTRTPVSWQITGGQATITAPSGASVAAQDSADEPQTIAKPMAHRPSTALPLTIEAPPGTPIPETIIVNLKTPLTYTVQPGKQSGLLSHRMIDGVQYEWRAGAATYWQNETPDPALPVWAVITQDKPADSYVSDAIDFVVHAAPDALPGDYEVKISIVLRDYVKIGVPVVVTVPPTP